MDEKDFELDNPNYSTQNHVKKNNFLYITIASIAAVAVIVILILIFTKDSHYEKGTDYLKENKYEAALIEFRNVSADDENYEIAQSKIYFINGLLAYNDKDYPEASRFLSKVSERDEYYREARQMLENISSLSLNENKINGAAIDTVKQNTIIKEKIVSPTITEKNTPKEPTTKAPEKNEEQINKNYIQKAENLFNKFEALYSSARATEVSNKNSYLSQMKSLRSQLSGLSYNPSEKNPIVTEMSSMIRKFMDTRLAFIQMLINDGTVTETPNSRSKKEEGDKLYHIAQRQISKAKGYYNI